MNKPRLIYFKPEECREWFRHMDCRLLVLMDSLRHQWGRPIRISGHEESLGRHQGNSASWHNIDRYGLAYAADIFPDGLYDRHSVVRFVDLAIKVGFTGIGVYSDTSPGIMIHLDTRYTHKPGDPALWGAIADPFDGTGRQYVSYKGALESIV